MVSEEAFKQLLDIGDRNILSTSQDVRLKDWMQLMDEIKNKVDVAAFIHDCDYPEKRFIL